MFAQSRHRLLLAAFATALIVSVGAPAEAVTPKRATGLKASTTSNSATISWSRAANATKYRVCLQTYKNQSLCAVVSAKTAGRTMTLKHLVPSTGADYFAKVYSYNKSHRAVSRPIAVNLKLPAGPASPTGLKQTVGTSSATITWSPAARATSYSVCLMTSGKTESCSRTSPKTATRSATFASLTPTTGADYFYRVYAYRGTQRSYSAKLRFDLPVGAITGLESPAPSTDRISLAWDPATNADGYDVQLATNAAMTSGLRKDTATGTSSTVTGLVPGTTYYYRLRGLNGSVPGAFTAVGEVSLPTNQFTTVVLTYNLCGQDKCVTAANGMKKWSARRPLAATIANSSGADVIATQESTTNDTNFGSVLPDFTLGAYKSAKSLFFKTAKYTEIRSGTITLDLNRGRYAVWVELQDKATRSNFIVSDAHLQPYKGVNVDRVRYAQTRVLLTEIAKINTDALPVVYAGDFNSNRANANQAKYPGGFDAPAKAFAEAGVADTYDTADAHANAIWNSSNQGMNPPAKHYDHLDHVFADRQIRATAWRVMISLSGSVYKTPFASDHNAVRATLTIPGKK